MTLITENAKNIAKQKFAELIANRIPKVIWHLLKTI